MKSKIKILSYIFFIILLCKSYVMAEKISILYKVENLPITNTDVSKELSYLILLNDQLKNLEKEKLVKYATKSIIKEKVKKIEIENKMQFGDNDKFVNNRLGILRQSLNLNNEGFEALLSEYGLTINYLKKKIELEYLWNRLIFLLYKDKLVINEENIKEKINEDINNPKNFINEFLLYEILYSYSQENNSENQLTKIKKSINEIGFENTANILSDSDSSKKSGKIGWIKENQLSKEIFNNINGLNIGEYTDTIDVPGGKVFLLLKDKRKVKKNLSFEDEFKLSVNTERNRQLDQFSAIYYKKVEINTKIYEN